MKQKLIPSLALLACMSLVSCDDDKTPATESFGDAVATLIIPADQSKQASAQMVQYTFEYNYGTNGTDFAINGLSYDDISYKFMQKSIPTSVIEYYNGKIQSFNTGAMTNENGGTPATNVSATIMTMLNFRPADIVDMMVVKRQYRINYTVADAFTASTFDSNAWYFGNTYTSYVYQNQHKEFTTDKPVYNVVLDLNAGTATVAIYNPVFAAEMPPSMASTVMQLEGLTLEYKHNTYQVTGESIVPKVREGALMVPNPRFTFDNFAISVDAANLYAAQISFKVAGQYDAIATVSCALDRNSSN